MKEQEMVTLKAEPESLEIDLKRTAVIVVDMQNAFVSKGGMLDLWGADISSFLKTIEPNKEIISAARAKRVKVVYVAGVFSPDLREIRPNSPFHFDKVIKTYREQPEARDKLLIRGTWGAEIIDELKPREDEILVEKPRMSAFVGTALDTMLKMEDIKYLAFTGVATNICVESSIRDACHLEYFTVLISDAAASSTPPRHEATIGNLKQHFGWVTTSKEFVHALR